MTFGYRIRKGDRLALTEASLSAVAVAARFRVLYDNGQNDDVVIDPYTTAGTPLTSSTVESRFRANLDGWIVGGSVSVAGTVTRTQLYVTVSTTDGNVSNPLCRGWVYTGHSLMLGENVQQLENDFYPNVVSIAGGSTIGDSLNVGEWITLDSGDVAGNAPISIPTAAPSASQLWELHQFLYTIKCDATVATRTASPQITTGMNGAAAMAQLADFIFANSLPSLTASQEGRVFVPRAPALVQLNDNGTITTGNTSPLPIMFSGQGLVISSTLVNGVVGDLHHISAWCRRVA